MSTSVRIQPGKDPHRFEVTDAEARGIFPMSPEEQIAYEAKRTEVESLPAEFGALTAASLVLKARKLY